MSRGIQTVEDFVHAFNEFLDEEDPMTPEEVDAELREAGYDPEEVGARMQAVAERALAESPWNWRSQARKELENERARLESTATLVPQDKAALIEAIQKLMSRFGGQVSYAYRSLETETVEDLVGLLEELEYLAAQKASRHE